MLVAFWPSVCLLWEDIQFCLYFSWVVWFLMLSYMSCFVVWGFGFFLKYSLFIYLAAACGILAP